jgi:hypothetical protein
MHRKYVAPQVRWADMVLPADWDDRDVQRLAKAIKIIHISKGKLGQPKT